MKLFKRNKTEADNAPVPEELKSYYDSPSGRKLWIRRILAILILVLVILAVAAAARAVYRSVTDDDMTTEKSDTTQSDQAPDPKPAESNTPAPAEKQPAQPATPKPAENNSQPAQTIPKTGDDAPATQPALPATGG